MVNEIQKVPGRYSGHMASPFRQPCVGFVQGLVDVHKCIDDGRAMVGWHLKAREGSREVLWCHVLENKKCVNKSNYKGNKTMKNTHLCCFVDIILNSMVIWINFYLKAFVF